jgi:SAM-dependent methyltransferase
MDRGTRTTHVNTELAALAALVRLGRRRRLADPQSPLERNGMSMQNDRTAEALRGAHPDPLKTQARAMWSQGDYHRFATELVWELGAVLVRACGIANGERVLDVAAGTGNTAIRAAEAGADVIALDITPEHFEAGRAEARSRGVELGWVEGDAEALPFDDAEFDVVTSSVGAIFAPHHQQVADELVRVCKPGGRIGMVNFTPEGLAGEFFELFGHYTPAPPPGVLPPVRWGDEAHVRGLFGNRLASLELARGIYIERAESPSAYRDFILETFGPAVAVQRSLEPDRAAAFARDLLQFATRTDRGRPGASEYPYEYLLVVGRKQVV